MQNLIHVKSITTKIRFVALRYMYIVAWFELLSLVYDQYISYVIKKMCV